MKIENFFVGKLARSAWGLTFIFDDSHDIPKQFELHALNTDQNMDLKFFSMFSNTLKFNYNHLYRVHC
jgi:hypothetical protein